MKDRANSVAAISRGSAPSTASRRRKRAGNRGKRTAHVTGMGWSFDEFEAGNSTEHVGDAAVDRDVRSEAHMPMKERSPVHWNVHDRREPFCAVGKDLAQMGDVKMCDVAGGHDVGHVIG